jgi:hypothetical protein
MYPRLGLLLSLTLICFTAAESVAPGDGLQAAFAEADITPQIAEDRPVYLAGYGFNRPATGVHDPLLARCVVLADGGQRVAIVSVDLIGLQLPAVRRIRDRLKHFSYVVVSSTHNHEGPDTIGIWGPSPLACVPGEIYPELVYGRFEDPADPAADFPEAELEPSVAEVLDGKKWMLLGLANDEIGYIIPRRQWDSVRPYAYGRPRAQYGEINSCGPGVAPAIMRALANRVAELSGYRSARGRDGEESP